MTGGSYVDWNAYPFSLDVAPGDRLSIKVKYDSGSIRAGAATDVLDGFEVLLSALAEGVEERTVASWIDLLDESERRRRADQRTDFQASLRRGLRKIRRSATRQPRDAREQ
jgi:hypothetical protein